MNKKLPYTGDDRPPVFLHEVTVNGRKLVKGMEVTLERGNGYPTGRYRFEYAEDLPMENAAPLCLLTCYGPLTVPGGRERKERYRLVHPSLVRTIHRSK